MARKNTFQTVTLREIHAIQEDGFQCTFQAIDDKGRPVFGYAAEDDAINYFKPGNRYVVCTIHHTETDVTNLLTTYDPDTQYYENHAFVQIPFKFVSTHLIPSPDALRAIVKDMPPENFGYSVAVGGYTAFPAMSLPCDPDGFGTKHEMHYQNPLNEIMGKLKIYHDSHPGDTRLIDTTTGDIGYMLAHIMSVEEMRFYLARMVLLQLEAAEAATSAGH